ncbi:MAG TPA: DUF2569 domain-containing protein, partial [Povalibacter sp.]|nr:DUF2569 domain-containing protein [Povalibacter sp.]
EVVAWALAEYDVDSLSPQMQEQVKQWQSTPGTPAERIVEALRFVQDQIRYTGIEIGPGAYRPTPPDRVFQRRYGDCKDKVLLLTTLLHALGVDARPALVNTSLREHVAGLLPHPGAFDHAIVRVRLEGKTYWFDATRSLQGGTLRSIVQAYYGLALVVAPDAGTLERIDEPVIATPTTRVTETFDLRRGLYASGSLLVNTVYRGADADDMRRNLQSQTSAELSQRYLDYYRDWYPGIRADAKPESRDDRGENRIEIIERYTLDPGFHVEDDRSLRFEMNPYIVKAHAKAPKKTVRTSPLAVPHPVNVHYHAIVQLPEDWSANTGVVKVEDPAFVYRSNVKYAQRRIDASFEFRTLTDHVDAARVPAYAARLSQVRDDAGYALTHAGNSAAEAAPVTGSNLNVALVLAALLGLGGGVMVVSFLRRRVPAPTEPVPPETPRGLAGWLILPMLHSCVLPIAVAISLYAYRPYLDTGTWANIGAGASGLATQMLQLGYLAIVAAGAAILVAGGYALILLFTRNRRFPGTYILLTWSVFGWAAVSAVVVISLPHATPQDIGAAIRDVVQTFLGSAVWTSYMVMSRRVRATFVQDRSLPPIAAVTQPA